MAATVKCCNSETRCWKSLHDSAGRWLGTSHSLRSIFEPLTVRVAFICLYHSFHRFLRNSASSNSSDFVMTHNLPPVLRNQSDWRACTGASVCGLINGAAVMTAFVHLELCACKLANTFWLGVAPIWSLSVNTDHADTHTHAVAPPTLFFPSSTTPCLLLQRGFVSQ